MGAEQPGTAGAGDERDPLGGIGVRAFDVGTAVGGGPRGREWSRHAGMSLPRARRPPRQMQGSLPLTRRPPRQMREPR